MIHLIITDEERATLVSALGRAAMPESYRAVLGRLAPSEPSNTPANQNAMLRLRNRLLRGEYVPSLADHIDIGE